MRVPQLEGKGVYLAPIFLLLFVFFMPISAILKSIFLSCSLAAILFTPHYRKHLFFAYNTFWGRAAICFFSFILIACLWSSAPYSMQWSVVGKYCKVIYFPILAVGFIHPRVRNLSINFYLASIVIICILSILKSQSIFLVGDAGEVFYNRIMTGFMIAFGSYLAALMSFQNKGWLRVLYFLLFLLTSYQVFFINTGKTGYVIYVLLMSLLLVLKLSFKRAVLGVLFLSCTLGLVYHESVMMQVRVKDLLDDVKLLQHHNENTSFGYRIQFNNYAKSLFATHPLIGIGTGSFTYRFSIDNPVPAWGNELSDPHSQYWLILSEQGLLGLLFLLTFLGSLFIASSQLIETRPILLGALLSFSVGAFSETMLCYSIAGYLLFVMGALALGELIEKNALKNKVKEKAVIHPDFNALGKSQV